MKKKIELSKDIFYCKEVIRSSNFDEVGNAIAEALGIIHKRFYTRGCSLILDTTKTEEALLNVNILLTKPKKG
jgi:hypothetical protein